MICYSHKIYSQNVDKAKITDKLNKIEPTIDFMYKLKNNTFFLISFKIYY